MANLEISIQQELLLSIKRLAFLTQDKLGYFVDKFSHCTEEQCSYLKLALEQIIQKYQSAEKNTEGSFEEKQQAILSEIEDAIYKVENTEKEKVSILITTLHKNERDNLIILVNNMDFLDQTIKDSLMHHCLVIPDAFVLNTHTRLARIEKYYLSAAADVTDFALEQYNNLLYENTIELNKLLKSQENLENKGGDAENMLLKLNL